MERVALVRQLRICRICRKKITGQGKFYCSNRCRYADHSNVVKRSYTPELKSVRRQAANSQWDSRIPVRDRKKLERELAKGVQVGRSRSVIRESRFCQNCETEFEFADHHDRKGIFCSRKCHIEWTRKNSTNYRIIAFAHHPKHCFYCESKIKLIAHHIDRNRTNNAPENLQILCVRCHNKQHEHERILARRSKFLNAALATGARELMRGLRLDFSDSNFKHSVERIVRSWSEIMEGIGSENEVRDLLSDSYPSDYDGIVSTKGITAFSLCPHHFLPVQYKIAVGYLPRHKVVGLSKLWRAVDLLARRPVLQEVLTDDIARVLTSTLDTRGVMVIVEGEHACVRMRGVRGEGTVITSSLRGAFKTDKGLRNEFSQLLLYRPNAE